MMILDLTKSLNRVDIKSIKALILWRNIGKFIKKELKLMKIHKLKFKKIH